MKPKIAPETITLLCRHCGGPFRTPAIVDVCPVCITHQPILLGGEMSGS